YVDGDACPVKDEVLRVAARHKVMVYLVSNMWLRGEADPLVQRIVVANDKLDAADDWIAERVQPHDVVITADIPLAARSVAKGAVVLRPNGHPLDQTSIGMAAAMRDLNTHLRDTGQITGGPGAFTKQDRSRFLDKLETLLRAAISRQLA
ncbi:MAG: YaiI/YqxD family protein, partial [Rhodospirillaceae bacterium]|nr:YaiI/YqxD family protein [Rhodospirillaceae bacterium]